MAWHPSLISQDEKQRHGMVVPVICYIVFLLQIPSPLPLALEIDGVLVVDGVLIFSRESDTPNPLPKNRNRLSRCENYTATKKEKKRAKKRGKNCMSSFLPPCFLAAASRNPHVNSPRHVS